MFNEYGAADLKLVELSDSIEKLFLSFLDENSITDPVVLRAVAHFTTSGIDCCVSERVLRRAVKIRKGIVCGDRADLAQELAAEDEADNEAGITGTERWGFGN